MQHEVAERFQERALLPHAIRVALEHDVHLEYAIGEVGVVYVRALERRREVAARRFTRDEPKERLARVQCAVAPALVGRGRTGVYVPGSEGDHRTDRMNVLAAPKRRSRRANSNKAFRSSSLSKSGQ